MSTILCVIVPTLLLVLVHFFELRLYYFFVRFPAVAAPGACVRCSWAAASLLFLTRLGVNLFGMRRQVCLQLIRMI